MAILSWMELLRHQTAAVGCPLLGARVSCGLFGVSDDFIERHLSLDETFVRHKASTFFLRAAGDSMAPTIKARDFLIVDRSISAFDRRVCVVVYEQQLICKRVHVHADHVLLLSDNPKYAPIKINEDVEALIWGVVTARFSHL